VLARRHRKVVKRGRDLAGLDAVALHALRIDIKKARYAAEFFSTLYEARPVSEFTGALAHLQSLLGGLNDAATVERLRTSSRPPCLCALLWGGYRTGAGWAVATARSHLGSCRGVEAFRDVKFW
jgi:hypothetical protein